MNTNEQHYGEEFYAQQIEGSLRSAKLYISHLRQIILFESAIDVGCGRGTWLSAMLEAGVNSAHGIDGPWNSQDAMLDQRIVFQSHDFNEALKLDGRRFDLAMSLEVAEHLEPKSTVTFIQALTSVSDVVLFGAAFERQGGTNHINERRPSAFATEFKTLGYEPFDVFRPTFWGDKRVESWYRQNTFLYAKTDSPAHARIASAGYQPMRETAFMDCMHPDIYLYRIPSGETPSDFTSSVRIAKDFLLEGLRRRARGR